MQISPATSSFATVTGTATLGGATVNAVFASGSYISKQYTILTATGGVSGTFGSLVNTNLPANFSTALSYDANNAYLNLTLNFTQPELRRRPERQSAGGRQCVHQFLQHHGGIPMVFGTLTPGGLTQISGETATGSQQTTFDAMSQFMGVMTDPFMNRARWRQPAPGATGYAERGRRALTPRTSDRRLCDVHQGAGAPAYEPRWSVWAAGFGGSQSTDGNAAVGSNNTTAASLAPRSALTISSRRTRSRALRSPAAARTSRSRMAAPAIPTCSRPALTSVTPGTGLYLRRAGLWLAGHHHQPHRDRRRVRSAPRRVRRQRVLGASRRRLSFCGPLDRRHRITPYAAAQFTTFDLPGYAEQAFAGANTFALGYGAKDVTDTRSELGIRTDKSFAMTDGILTLRGRVAWAHDYDPDRSIAATFQTLPGASFVVNGAAQASDFALVTASIEKKWLNGWSAAATFEGEFSDVTRSYAGKGVVRYEW